MPKAHSPRKGSLAFRPRMRARRINCRVRNWPGYSKPSLLGFAGYKAGMLHFIYNEDLAVSPNKGKEVAMAGTLIEVPPMLVFGVRVLKKTPYGLKILGDYCVKDAAILKKAGVRDAKPIDELDKVKGEVAEVRVLALTNPALTTIGKKTHDCVEIGVGGDNIEKQVEYAKGLLGKEVEVDEAFSKGDYVDIIGVTKGKGWQGVIKRFGIAIQRPKATNKRRHLGNLGSWHPPFVEYSIAQAGQMGYHKRTTLNNVIVDIGPADKLKQNGGLLHYGVVKNKYVLVKGSIPGTKKRLIKLRRALRKPAAKRELKVTFMSKAM